MNTHTAHGSPQSEPFSCWQLWAKTGSNNRWHALPCHLLDVAAAAEALWERLSETNKTPAVRALGGDSGAKRTCVFLAAAHDVGKANRFFQAKVNDQRRRLRALALDLPNANDDQPRHGQASGAYLKPWLVNRWKWSGPFAGFVARAVGGHHGVFFPDTKRTWLTVDIEPWNSIGNQILDGLASALCAADTPPEPMPLNPFLGWLAGFICVADWIGSHENMTVWQTTESSLTAYLHEARKRADQLLSQQGWLPSPRTALLAVADMLPAGRTPNSLQIHAAELATDFALAIIEAPTGEGKTEAAFALAEPARSSGSGIYFALPTMATANGLYDRVKAYLRKATGRPDLETRLLHSQAWLFRDRAETAEDPGEEGRQQDVQAQDWFGGPKRGLLAPFSVGTIDQALIGALRAKHGFVRLFALAGKTIVIDEVHAYDIYIADLLAVLLGWLHALSCRVILLSATLPKARRNALLNAWSGCEQSAASEYPCITCVTEDGNVKSCSIKVPLRKLLSFDLISSPAKDAWETGAALILHLVRSNGGLGALLLNTVHDAQEALDWLERQDLGNVCVELFHGRFTAHDRAQIERRVLDQFGRAGRRTQPTILVATQVVEQSLDLDFDHAVSALAPIDLLIQRAGRLHRHYRRSDGSLLFHGPDERPDPVLYVLAPPLDQNEIPELHDPIYSHDVLMRTLRYLRSSPSITRPADIAAAVESVYTDADRDASKSAWEAKLNQLEEKTALDVQLRQRLAADATIGLVNDHENLIVDAFLDLDENDERHGSQLAARTRLEDCPSVTVVLLEKSSEGSTTVHGGDSWDPRNGLLASIRISPPYPLWAVLIDIEPRSAWRRRGSLSHARPLLLSKGEVMPTRWTASVAGFEIHYDERRGLHWNEITHVST